MDASSRRYTFGRDNPCCPEHDIVLFGVCTRAGTEPAPIVLDQMIQV
jgi:hypothetical protein